MVLHNITIFYRSQYLVYNLIIFFHCFTTGYDITWLFIAPKVCLSHYNYFYAIRIRHKMAAYDI